MIHFPDIERNAYIALEYITYSTVNDITVGNIMHMRKVCITRNSHIPIFICVHRWISHRNRTISALETIPYVRGFRFPTIFWNMIIIELLFRANICLRIMPHSHPYSLKCLCWAPVYAYTTYELNCCAENHSSIGIVLNWSSRMVCSSELLCDTIEYKNCHYLTFSATWINEILYYN